MKSSPCKTPEQVSAELAERGESLAEWAKRNNVCVQATYRVMRQAREGGLTAVRGECHRAAVLLGLKKGIARPPRSSGREAAAVARSAY